MDRGNERYRDFSPIETGHYMFWRSLAPSFVIFHLPGIATSLSVECRGNRFEEVREGGDTWVCSSSTCCGSLLLHLELGATGPRKYLASGNEQSTCGPFLQARR